MMGQAFWQMERYENALRRLLEALSLLVQLKIEPKTQEAMANTLIGWRQELGAGSFDPLWEKVTDAPLPDWLAETKAEENHGQGLSIIEWVRQDHPRCAFQSPGRQTVVRTG